MDNQRIMHLIEDMIRNENLSRKSIEQLQEILLLATSKA